LLIHLLICWARCYYAYLRFYLIFEMAKYKLKTNQACAKRFKKTASGKFLAKQGGVKHLNAKMRSKTKRRLGKHVVLNDSNTMRLPLLLPYA
jgi:large subunit ribosomal protein L35